MLRTISNIYDATFCKKQQHSALKKSSYIFRKWNFLALVLRNFLYFLKINFFLYSRKWKPPKNFLYFLKKAFLVFQETETPKQILMFQEKEFSYISKVTFRARKIKKKPIINKKEQETLSVVTIAMSCSIIALL